jgi:hypothetical protein
MNSQFLVMSEVLGGDDGPRATCPLPCARALQFGSHLTSRGVLKKATCVRFIASISSVPIIVHPTTPANSSILVQQPSACLSPHGNIVCGCTSPDALSCATVHDAVHFRSDLIIRSLPPELRFIDVSPFGLHLPDCSYCNNGIRP